MRYGGLHNSGKLSTYSLIVLFRNPIPRISVVSISTVLGFFESKGV